MGYELFPNALVLGEKPCSRLFAFTSFHLASRYEEFFSNFRWLVFSLPKVLIQGLLSHRSVFWLSECYSLQHIWPCCLNQVLNSFWLLSQEPVVLQEHCQLLLNTVDKSGRYQQVISLFPTPTLVLTPRCESPLTRRCSPRYKVQVLCTTMGDEFRCSSSTRSPFCRNILFIELRRHPTASAGFQRLFSEVSLVLVIPSTASCLIFFEAQPRNRTQRLFPCLVPW